MMKKIKNITIFIFITFVASCGYSPLLNSQKANFYISDLNFSGDRQVNNYISNNFKKYRNYKENAKSFKINIISSYEKTVVNKDDKGNPKNYYINIKTIIKVISSEGREINKSFERNTSLSAQDKKIDEKELEKKYKKNLSNLLGNDIVFFLINQ